jgi:malate/lactate dehydrogenase
MIDPQKNILMNHVMDINVAGKSRHDLVVRGGEYADLSASDIVIIAAGSHPPRLEANLLMIKEIGQYITRYCPDAIVIMASNPVDLLNYAFYKFTGKERQHLMGYNCNDSTRFRIDIATALKISPSRRVEGLVLGTHPEGQVLLFSSITVDGKSVTLDDPTQELIRFKSKNYIKEFDRWYSGRTTGWTCAAGLTYLVQAIKNNLNEVIPVSTVVDGEYGFTDLSIGLPTVIGKAGVCRILNLDLTSQERQELDAAAQVMKTNCQLIKNLPE